MKILLTGNQGYIGPVVARHFRRKFPAATLIGFDIGYFAGCVLDARSFPEVMLDAQLYGDVRRPPEELFRDVDAVVHLAAISNDPMGNAFAKVTDDINAKAVASFAYRAKAAGVRSFVFASSCSVYGAAANAARVESSELNPLTAYARSKIDAERSLAALATDEFKVTCLRFATACGFSERLRLDLVLNDFVASAVTAGKITILSDGTPWRPLIHVKDMARAIEWAICRPLEAGGPHLVLNVGNEEWTYQVLALAEAVRARMGTVDIHVNQNATPDQRSYQVDFSLFKQLAPKHQPCEKLDETVAELSEGLRRSGFIDSNFRHSNYIRLKVLNELRLSGRLSDELSWTAA